MTQPRILLVNDDGIHAEGLRFLWEALVEVAHVTIVAPKQDQSGAGLSVTFRSPLHLEPVAWDSRSDAYSLSGTPGDCVKIALNSVMVPPPDFIFSGINCGSNAGRNTFYSGTVGAAIEGAFHDIPSLALSCQSMKNPCYSIAAQAALELLEAVQKENLPKGVVLNINFPDTDQVPYQGLAMAQQGRSYWKESPLKRMHPGGTPYFWLWEEQAECSESEETDITLLKKGYGTIVPLAIEDLTHTETVLQYQNHFKTLVTAQ